MSTNLGPNLFQFTRSPDNALMTYLNQLNYSLIKPHSETDLFIYANFMLSMLNSFVLQGVRQLVMVSASVMQARDHRGQFYMSIL